jgi:hypothetical protein
MSKRTARIYGGPYVKPQLKGSKAPREAEDHQPAIFFQKSRSIQQEFLLVERTIARELYNGKLQAIIGEVKNKTRVSDDECICETFTLLNQLRDTTCDLIECCGKWQQGFTTNIRPELCECDYLVEMISKIDYVISTIYRREFNFQFPRGNVFLLTNPNPRTLIPNQVSTATAEQIIKFSKPDEERIVNCYQVLLECLPPIDYKRLYPLAKWINSRWIPKLLLTDEPKLAPKPSKHTNHLSTSVVNGSRDGSGPTSAKIINESTLDTTTTTTNPTDNTPKDSQSKVDETLNINNGDSLNQTSDNSNNINGGILKKTSTVDDTTTTKDSIDTLLSPKPTTASRKVLISTPKSPTRRRKTRDDDDDDDDNLKAFLKLSVKFNAAVFAPPKEVIVEKVVDDSLDVVVAVVERKRGSTREVAKKYEEMGIEEKAEKMIVSTGDMHSYWASTNPN